MKIPFYVSVLLAAVKCLSGEVSLAWDASPSTNVTYILYASTNALSDSNKVFQVRLNTGTNCQATISDLAVGQWSFADTALDTSGAESKLSGVLIIQVPEAPAKMRVIVPQYSGSVTGSWQDVGFFRLKIQ